MRARTMAESAGVSARSVAGARPTSPCRSPSLPAGWTRSSCSLRACPDSRVADELPVPAKQIAVAVIGGVHSGCPRCRGSRASPSRRDVASGNRDTPRGTPRGPGSVSVRRANTFRVAWLLDWRIISELLVQAAFDADPALLLPAVGRHQVDELDHACRVDLTPRPRRHSLREPSHIADPEPTRILFSYPLRENLTNSPQKRLGSQYNLRVRLQLDKHAG
jgi:hypothetical protein